MMKITLADNSYNTIALRAEDKDELLDLIGDLIGHIDENVKIIISTAKEEAPADGHQ